MQNGTLMRNQCVVIQERQGKQIPDGFFLMFIFFLKRKINKKEAHIKSRLIKMQARYID